MRPLEEELWTEVRANETYEDCRARGRMKAGRRFGGPPKPYTPPATPEGRVTVGPDALRRAAQTPGRRRRRHTRSAARRRGLLARRTNGTHRRSRHPGAHPAGHQPPADDPAELGRRPLRLHAKSPGDRARRRALPPATTDDRAGVREDEVQPRPRPLTRRGRGAVRIEWRLITAHAQSPQVPPTRPRGRVTAAGPAAA